jgi:hypothetical protein
MGNEALMRLQLARNIRVEDEFLLRIDEALAGITSVL